MVDEAHLTDGIDGRCGGITALRRITKHVRVATLPQVSAALEDQFQRRR